MSKQRGVLFVSYGRSAVWRSAHFFGGTLYCQSFYLPLSLNFSCINFKLF